MNNKEVKDSDKDLHDFIKISIEELSEQDYGEVWSEEDGE